MSDKRISVFTNDDATVNWRHDSQGNVQFYVDMDDGSPIQGPFSINLQTQTELQDLEPRHRARLATLFLELQATGNLPHEITVELIEQAQSRQPLSAIARAERLLRFLYDETDHIGNPLAYSWGDGSATGLLLHSESVDQYEARFLLDYLKNHGLVKIDYMSGALQATMEVEGLAHIAEQITAPDTSQAFVAMWFHDTMEALYDEGIKPALEEAGYTPLRVDRQPTLHRIDDQIIAEIRKSRFLIADFTHDERGARGSVYYEAGFAMGLGLPVIYTCRQDQLDELHFDTRQYPHIGWTEPSELRHELRYHIEALIGSRPRAETG